MGSVVVAMVEDTAAVALLSYQRAKSVNMVCRGRFLLTARMISDSSMVRKASPTASPTLMPAFLSSSAAARRRGFSFMLEVS